MSVLEKSQTAIDPRHKFRVDIREPGYLTAAGASVMSFA
jgi:hypothetical protein